MKDRNEVLLKGRVGTIKVSQVGSRMVANISLATNRSYKDKDDNWVVETTWHSVVAWSGGMMPSFETITKGTPILVTGELRNKKYTDRDGIERTITEVLANDLDIIQVERSEGATTQKSVSKPSQKTDDDDWTF